jgi:hypothetical protein
MDGETGKQKGPAVGYSVSFSQNEECFDKLYNGRYLTKIREKTKEREEKGERQT